MKLTIMSCNIRIKNFFDGKNRWMNRKNKIIQIIRKYTPDFIGFQEALPSQLKFLVSELSALDYNYYAIGRDNGKLKGESVPIFYKKNLFVKHKGTFWLSDTPDIPSKCWSDIHNRIVSWVQLTDASNNTSLMILNSHLAHKSKEARLKSIPLVRKFIQQQISQHKNSLPILMVGDFNMEPSSEEYNMMNEFLLDPFDSSNEPNNVPSKHPTTFHDFTGEIYSRPALGKKERLDRIDYCWVNSFVKNAHSAIIHDNPGMKSDVFPSDHWFLVTEFEI